jgi:biotin operon repressor
MEILDELKDDDLIEWSKHRKEFFLPLSKEVQEQTGISVNVVSKLVNQLVDLGIIVPDSTVVKKGYRYQKIYDIFVGKSYE